MNAAGLPLLIVAGFPRTGTTSIYKNLEAHPGFAVPVRKELNYFSKASPPPFATYERHFAGRADGQVCVDISPMYSLESRVPARLAEAAPQAHVVVLVREPAVWIHSLYVQMCGYSLKPPSFSEFLQDGLYLMPDPAESVRLPIREGLYERTLSAFAQVFGDRMLVIDFAAFEKDPLEVLKRMEAFVGAPSFFDAQAVDARPHNSSTLARRYPAFVRHLLSQEILIATAVKLLPQGFLRRFRGLLYYARKDETTKPAAVSNQAELSMAAEAMAADRAVYERLFRTSPFLLGAELSFGKAA